MGFLPSISLLLVTLQLVLAPAFPFAILVDTGRQRSFVLETRVSEYVPPGLTMSTFSSFISSYFFTVQAVALRASSYPGRCRSG